MRCWPNQGSHTEIPVQATQRRESLIRTSAEQNYQRARTPAGGPVASDSPKGPNCQSVARKMVRTRSARKSLAVASRPWRTSRVLVGRCMHEPDSHTTSNSQATACMSIENCNYARLHMTQPQGAPWPAYSCRIECQLTYWASSAPGGHQRVSDRHRIEVGS